MEYFSIYPFTQDREDYRMARIVEAINNGVQGLAYRDKKWEFFLPDYLGERIPQVKSEEQKLAEEKAFVNMAIAAGFAVMEKK